MSLTRIIRTIIDPEPPSDTRQKHAHLTGLRGVLTIQMILWMFLSTFVPASVKTADPTRQAPGPTYAVILRKTVGTLLWNESLIYSSFIFLSARTICIPFFKSHSKLEVASSCFKRGVRFWLPVFAALGAAWGLLSALRYSSVDAFLDLTKNTNVHTTLYRLPHAGAFFNAVFNVFWINKNFFSQAANLAFPTQTLWMVSMVYEQSYTVYMTMVLIPYTRPAWRVQAMLVFIASAWWVQSWAWYSITGMLLADAVVNMNLVEKSRAPLTRWNLGSKVLTVPKWILYAAMMLAGFIMQYIYVSWRPTLSNEELKGHTGLYNQASLNADVDLRQPQARMDNYLIIMGFFLLMETYESVKWVLSFGILKYFGERSLSYFLTTPTILYTVGIKVFMYLRVEKNWPLEPTVGIVGLAVLPIMIIIAEIFLRLVDRPSKSFAEVVWVWITS